MTFDRKELAAFLAVARRGSIGSAAAELSLTQPAISRILHRLENRLGAPLFVRHASGMDLNAFGRALLPHAELIEAESRRVQEEIDMLKGSATGLVRAGVVPSIATQLLPRAIRATLRQSPGLHIHIAEGTGSQLLSALMRRDIDFAIVGLWHEPLADHVIAAPLIQDEVCVICRQGHPLLGMSQPGLVDLLAYPWALPEKGNVIRSELHATFLRAGLEPPTAVVTANAIHTLKALVAATDFLTVLARESFQLEAQAGLLSALPLRQATWTRQLVLLQRAQGRLLPAAALLVSEIRKRAQPGD